MYTAYPVFMVFVVLGGTFRNFYLSVGSYGNKVIICRCILFCSSFIPVLDVERVLLS